ncbi:hypothetical protein P154DRAFT_527848 [Amniculicola lignicola CBS 123094]|uniref:RNA exonuclease 4 n=1 Tax=Amniculicola lignicola CBS 123094 TaxID=1392246 RepID=A0A6A5VU32_9PLEO|nr:hypothetical protein P154DRAFT_527848 [Amniculicola lignicola CBS 123094]
MAPIDTKNLSSNWKRLQQRLRPSTKAQPLTTDAKEEHGSLKRKRTKNPHGDQPPDLNVSTRRDTEKSAPHKTPPSRKRQRMEEPASVGASAKRADAGSHSLSKSKSMPHMRQKSLHVDPEDASQAISILTPYNAELENEGVSPTALPGRYIALDCEMVGTGPEPDRDSALARVSVVNFHGHQIYDSYVQVAVPVTDFRTAVSGIEPRHIKSGVARTFKEVHNDLKILLTERVLVGHAIKNDLDALMLKHEKRFIRDTSKYSKFREIAPIPGRTPGLKHLVLKLLGVEIQTGKHNSVEDARATMALFRLEKEGFDQEVIKMYGSAGLDRGVQGVGADGNGDGTAKKKNNSNRKKKKKKKKN